MLFWLVVSNWFESVGGWCHWCCCCLCASVFQRHHLTTVKPVQLIHSSTRSPVRPYTHTHSYTTQLFQSRRHKFVSPITLIRFEMVLSVYIQLSYVSIFASFGLRITNKIKFSTNSSNRFSYYTENRSLVLVRCLSFFAFLPRHGACLSTNCKIVGFYLCDAFYTRLTT